MNAHRRAVSNLERNPRPPKSGIRSDTVPASNHGGPWKVIPLAACATLLDVQQRFDIAFGRQITREFAGSLGALAGGPQMASGDTVQFRYRKLTTATAS